MTALGTSGTAAPTLAGLARIGAGPTSMVNAGGLIMLPWRAQLAKIRLGVEQVARLAIVGDSKSAGAGAGTGSQKMDGAFAKSWPSQLAARLAADGLIIRDAWFGAAGMGTIPAVLAYDPRRTGFSGWGGGTVSLGGAALAAGSTAGIGSFQPSRAVDRHSLFVATGTGGGQLKVAKGSESFTINTVTGSPGFQRVESVFTTKSADPIQYSWLSGGFVNVVGGVAWDGALPSVEVANFSIYGTTSGVQASATAPAAPLNALGTYAPHATLVKIGTNDLNTGVPMTTWEANVRAIVAKGRVTGTVGLIWPSIGGTSPTYGSDNTRAAWRARAIRIALDLGAAFFDEEALLGGRAGANSSGALPDSVHAAEWAQAMEAAAFYHLLRG